jgi:AcrR family transcriptional regulator
VTKPASDTRRRIQDVARELFSEKGVQRTSLQDIASRLGITKPALYYHFSSREELVRSILQPLIDEGERFLAEQEKRSATDPAKPRELLEGYFDFHFRHRADLVYAVTELTTLADLGLIDKMLAWRDRLCKLVFGPRPPSSSPPAESSHSAGYGIAVCSSRIPRTKNCALQRWRAPSER